MGDRKTMRVAAIVLALVLCLARANEYDFDNDVPEELLSRTEAVVPEEMLTQGLHSVRYKGAAPDVDLSEVVEWSLDKNAKYDYGEECFEKGRWEPCDKYGKKCVKYSCGGRIKKRRRRHVRDGGRGRYMERKRKAAARKKATEKRCASKWRCGVSGLSTPVAINARTGDVQCMSTNGKDCWWGRCRGRKVPRHGRLRPLVCGAHHKKMWGGTGYNNKHHWCNKVKKPVAKMCKQRKFIRRPLRRRL